MRIFLFPGQGSQEVGMGADLFKSDTAFRSLVGLASEWVGEDLESICLRGPEKKLVRSKFLQPLLVAVSLGYLRHLTERGVNPDVVLGHSLGEITALAAAGIVTPEEAVRIAAKRGELMEGAAGKTEGAMLAVILEDRTKLLAWLASPAAGHRVVLANDNAPTQVVLAGERSALTACADFIHGERLGKCRLLSVSGPWHSPFMEEAATQFGAWLSHVPLRPPRVPVVFNASAATAVAVEDIRSLVGSLPARPVRWRDCMASLRGVTSLALCEVGPGRVLSGLARANGLPRDTLILNVNNLRGVELAARELASVPSGVA